MDDLGSRLRQAHTRISSPEPAYDRLVDRKRRKRRTSRIASLAMALVVTAAGVAGAVIALGHTGTARHRPGFSDGGSPASGRSLALAPGQFFYEKVHAITTCGASVQGSAATLQNAGGMTQESWWGYDGSGRLEPISSNGCYGPAPAQTWGAGDYKGDDLSELSTDPNTLSEQLLGRSAPNGASPEPQVTPAPGLSLESGETWRAVTALLETSNAQPDLQNALFQVASQIDGATMLESTTDPVGRAAVGIRYAGYGGVFTLYFDPDTHLFMAEDENWGSEGHWYWIVEEAGVVQSTDQRPTQDQAFFPPPQVPAPAPTSGYES